MFDGYNAILSADQIKTMLAVADKGSFNKAAVLLGVQQSAVTHLVSRLETKLERRLFDRTSFGVKMTLDGEAVLIYSQSMLKLGIGLQRHLKQSVSDFVLRIGLTEDVGRTALPSVLGLFARQYREFRFEIVCGMPDMLFRSFDEERIDVVVARRVGDDPRGELLWSEDMAWVGAADTVLPIADPVPLVMPPPGGTRSAILAALQGASRPWQVRCESASLATLEAAVRAGLGIGAAPVGMPLFEIVHLDPESSLLPILGQARFVLEQRSPARSEAIEAFCDLLRTATRLSYAMGDEPAPGAG